MNEAAISIIQNYANKCRGSWRGRCFAEQSYSRWAADEITNRLIAQEPIFPWDIFYLDLKSPVEIIMEFISDMDDFSERSEDIDVRSIFVIAKEAAAGILDLFL
ncbi:MAG: hypothetical protein LBL35_01995 [Clostridiales bacterium]|jgi:hypothetical protein|nr:hypothetical protein [Clostridiales bacterium]